MGKTITITTGAALSFVTGRLVCPLDDIYKTANDLMGRPIFTHELPAAFRELAPWILAHCPQLNGIDGEDVTPKNWQEWIADKVTRFGPSVTLPPLTYSPTAEKSPIETAEELVGKDRVIGVEAPPDA